MILKIFKKLTQGRSSLPESPGWKHYIPVVFSFAETKHRNGRAKMSPGHRPVPGVQVELSIRQVLEINRLENVN